MADTDSLLVRVGEIIATYRDTDGPCLPILRALQDEFGYVPPESLEMIADGLNLSRADVYGVLSFYKDFRLKPTGRHVIRVCCAESCQAMDSRGLLDRVKNNLALDLGETSADGSFTLQPVFCLGNCSLSPSVTIDGEIYGRADADDICARLDELRQGVTA